MNTYGCWLNSGQYKKVYQKLISDHLVLPGSSWYSLVISPMANTPSNDVVRINTKVTTPMSLTLANNQMSMSLVAQITDWSVSKDAGPVGSSPSEIKNGYLMTKPQSTSSKDATRHNSKVKGELDISCSPWKTQIIAQVWRNDSLADQPLPRAARNTLADQRSLLTVPFLS